jgi:hypothetical protein
LNFSSFFPRHALLWGVRGLKNYFLLIPIEQIKCQLLSNFLKNKISLISKSYSLEDEGKVCGSRL